MDAGHHNAAEHMRPLTGGPSLKHLVFDWNARDKYITFKSIEMEATNIS